MHAKNLKHALFWLSRLKFLVLAGVSYFLKGQSSFDIQFFSSIEPTWSTDQCVFYFRNAWLTLFCLPTWLKSLPHDWKAVPAWSENFSAYPHDWKSLPEWLKKPNSIIKKPISMIEKLFCPSAWLKNLPPWMKRLFCLPAWLKKLSCLPTWLEKPTCRNETPTRMIEKPTCMIEKTTCMIEKPTCMIEKASRMIERPKRIIEKAYPHDWKAYLDDWKAYLHDWKAYLHYLKAYLHDWKAYPHDWKGYSAYLHDWKSCPHRCWARPGPTSPACLPNMFKNIREDRVDYPLEFALPNQRFLTDFSIEPAFSYFFGLETKHVKYNCWHP